jgi:hypothetical protein
MKRDRENLIAGLTNELEPVRAFQLRDGFAIVALSAIVTFALAQLGEGIWIDGISGNASPFFWVTNGLLLLLGFAATTTVITLASPSVGHKHEAPKWAVAMVGVLPLAAMISVFSRPEGLVVLQDGSVLHCISSAFFASLLTAAALIVWLRRGAPVSLNTAGWLTGLASGALGTVLYGLSCPIDTIAHLGIWHVVPIIATAIAGRIIVPPLVRW